MGLRLHRRTPRTQDAGLISNIEHPISSIQHRVPPASIPALPLHLPDLYIPAMRVSPPAYLPVSISSFLGLRCTTDGVVQSFLTGSIDPPRGGGATVTDGEGYPKVTQTLPKHCPDPAEGRPEALEGWPDTPKGRGGYPRGSISPSPSVAAHLVSLWHILEAGLNIRRAAQVKQRATRAKDTFVWLEPPRPLGSRTIIDVHAARNAEAHQSVVKAWAEEVWAAWSPHRATVRPDLSRAAKLT